jgi:hypothetical protein
MIVHVVQRAGLKMPRGWGWLRNPKKYAYNKVYNRTSFDIFKTLKIRDYAINLIVY